MKKEKVVKRPLLYLFITLFSFSNYASGEDKSPPRPRLLSDTILASSLFYESTIPIAFLKDQLRGFLLSENSMFTKIDHIQFDPQNRLLLLDAQIELPVSVLQSLDELTGQKSLKRNFQLGITLRFPSAAELFATSFVRFRLLRFELDGMSYTNALPIFTNFVGILLSSANFRNYILGPVTEESSELDPRVFGRRFIENNNIRVGLDSVSLRLNSSQFPIPGEYKFLENLRIWNFSPGLKEVFSENPEEKTYLKVFKFVVGQGAPPLELRNTYMKNEGDAERLMRLIYEEVYDEFIYSDRVREQIENFFNTALEFYPDDHTRLSAETFRRNLDRRARNLLSLDNPDFLAAPRYIFDRFEQELHRDVSQLMMEASRRRQIEQINRSFAREGVNANHIIRKRFSQRVIDQTVRYFKDFDFEGLPLFPQLTVQLVPQIPGFIIRGLINLDFNYLMSLGVEGDERLLGDLPVGLVDQRYGTGIPFELSLELQTLNDGLLGVDARRLSFFNGAERINFTRANQHGDFLFDFVKLAAVNSLASMAFNLDPDELKDTIYQVLNERIREQNQILTSISNQLSGSENLAQIIKTLTELEIEHNPFLKVANDFIADKRDLILSNVLKYDEDLGMLVINIDPKIVSEVFLDITHEAQLWNLVPIWDEKNNRTFLELDLGYFARNLSYLDQLNSRADIQNGIHFTGTRLEESSGADIEMMIDVKAFETLINKILANIATEQRLESIEALKKDQEYEAFITNNLNFEIKSDGNLSIKGHITNIEKNKRWRINPKRFFAGDWYEVRRELFFNANINISLDSLAKNRSGMSIGFDESFFSDTVLKVDFNEASLRTSGDVGVLYRIPNLFGSIDFNSGFGRVLLRLIVSQMGSMLHPPGEENENLRFDDFRLNNYVKIIPARDKLFIQLNPHILGQAYNVTLVQHESENNRYHLVNAEEQYIRFDFLTNGNMANYDKQQLFSIMSDAEKIFRPILNAETREELKNKLSDHQFANQLFRDSDYTKMSLFHRLRYMASLYDGVISKIGLDTSIIETLAAQIHRDLLIELPKIGSRDFSSTGVELMYFVSTAKVLMDYIDYFTDLAEEFSLEGHIPYYSDILHLREELHERYVLPLIKKYASDFSRNNAIILRRGVTDWNHSFYPEAKYSELVYGLIKGELGH